MALMLCEDGTTHSGRLNRGRHERRSTKVYRRPRRSYTCLETLPAAATITLGANRCSADALELAGAGDACRLPR